MGSAILKFAFALVISLALWSCGTPFESYKPPPTEIMYIVNDNQGGLGLPEDSQPLPLPIVDELPPGLAPSGPSTLAVGVPTKANLALSPFNASARFVFKVPDGGNAHCTGQIIGPNRDVLLTAAHCVYENDIQRWYDSFAAYTSYARPGAGAATYAAQLDWSCMAIFTGWAQGRFEKDYAFVKLRSAADHSLGLKLGLSESSFRSMGYPYNFYAGNELAVVEGTKGQVGGSIASMRSNPFLEGSSGGAWVANTSAIGLNSFGYDKEPNVMYGPVFDGSTQKLFDFVSGSCNQPASFAGAAPRMDSANVVVEAGTATLPVAGPEIVLRDSQKCSCAGSQEVVLLNGTGSDYMVSLRSTDFGGTNKAFIGSERSSYRSDTDSEVFLGCSIGDADGNGCELAADYELLQSRRNVSVEEGAGFVSMATIGPAFCAQQCLKNPFGGWCHQTGNSTTEIVAGLKGFLDGASVAAVEGEIVSTIDDLVVSFGGKPDEVVDPCERSAFYRTASGVLNEGIACRVTSAPVGETAQHRLSLWNPTQSEATELDPSSRIPLFGDDRKAPRFEFYGENAAILNEQFGGSVTSVSEVEGKLIVSTTNGCISATIATIAP